MGMQIKRLDHHGIVSGVIDDLGVVELLDAHLPQDEKQEISPGEAVKGMIMNGLGFSNRPMTLSPQFFTNLPMAHLFRPGVKAEYFNRHKLGRTLDQCFSCGTENLFSLVSRQACEREDVETIFQSIDTTSFSLTGRYETAPPENVEDSENRISEGQVGSLADTNIGIKGLTSQAPTDNGEDVIEIKHGYSKDHRPDLKQVVQELLVTQDGGIPLACKAWSGNSSDSTIFRKRAEALVASFQSSTERHYCIGDSKFYHKANAASMAAILFISRVPAAVKLEGEKITAALEANAWTTINRNYKYQEIALTHMGITQRWLVVYSSHARERAKKTTGHQVEKHGTIFKKALFHLQANRFSSEAAARKALATIEKGQKYHSAKDIKCIAHKQYQGKGRPKKDAVAVDEKWQIRAEIESNNKAIQSRIDKKSCFILATNAPSEALRSEQILERYKAQSCVEFGFRFLKEPLFFVSSLFIKKPSRIDALIMIMTMSLLIYSIAQRRMRANMRKDNATIPNQINRPTATPTLRWVFQCFEGINLVQTGQTYDPKQLHVDGLDAIRARIVGFLGGCAVQLYNIPDTG